MYEARLALRAVQVIHAKTENRRRDTERIARRPRHTWDRRAAPTDEKGLVELLSFQMVGPGFAWRG